MSVTKERWEAVAAEFLDEIVRTGNIPPHLVHPFWGFYHQEFRPGYYATMPCTCSGKEWSAMVNQVAETYLQEKQNWLQDESLQK